ncbi:P-loop ATPase, Sll1717 family [Leifsonia sp. 22587]|uniref:P-loop ATPase, Sll1717 family n=1 Tax=Leifsonia sp. 22587 TaxID=3453946 RepID=UPI003F86722F
MESVFFAYAWLPPLRAETMRNAAEQIQQAGFAATTWEDLPIEGSALIPTICQAIAASDCVIAEVSDLNSNVLFEAGYAIALGKEVWFAVDESDGDALRNWKDLGILATVGRIGYEGSSHSLSNRWVERRDDQGAPLLETLLINGRPREADAVFAPSTPLKFEASSTLEKHLDRQGHLRILGATEDLGLAPLDFYVKEIYRSSACIFHLLAPRRVRSGEHNARASFLAGIAHGLDLPLLVLIEEGGTVPLDYHDLTFAYSGSAQLIAKVDTWLNELPKAPGSNRRLGRLALDIELPIRSFGEYVAEYEKSELQNYFINTSEFESVLAGNTKVFVGRKGTGKTATMSQAVEELRRDRRILTVPIKPSAYELSGLARALRDLSSHGSSDYLVISLWTFLLYTEIALRAVSFARERIGASRHRINECRAGRSRA